MVRMGRQEWEARVNDFQVSGLSAVAWCAANNIKTHRLYYWLRRLRTEVAEPVGPSRWLSVETEEPQSPASSLCIRVGQATVEVKPGFDATLLADVVRTLAGLC